MYLCTEGVLRLPLLYLSLYLKTHRSTYYQMLQEVRERGAWEPWLRFFLEGVAETANGAFDAANRIVALFKEDRECIVATGARAGSVLRVHEMLQQYPLADAHRVAMKTGLIAPTVNLALSNLERLGIVAETTGRKRDRQFTYKAYLDILSEGTVPLSS